MTLTTGQLAVLFAFETLSAFGLWYAVGRSKISEPFRVLWSEWHFATHGKVRCFGCVKELDALQAHTERGYVCPGCKGECLPVPLEDPFLLRMVECPACFGFWEGVVTAIFVGPLLGVGAYGILLAPLLGCATLATNLLLARHAGLMQEPSQGEHNG